MKFDSKEMEQQAALQTAARMCAAARTAPKAHGRDTLHTLVLTGEEKDRFADEMDRYGYELMGEEMRTWYGRDANNIRASQALVLVAADRKQRGVPNCGFCGFGNCGQCKQAGGSCGFAFADLGIAVGAAEAVARADRVDCRVMYSAGKTAEKLEIFPDTCCLGLPLSISGKDIFHDRGITHK